MSTFQWLASFFLALTLVPGISAETRCPGKAASVPLQLTNGHQMIVAVSVNHSGPYKFLLDTGTEMTMVDPALAAELHLNPQSSTVVAGFGFQTTASVAQSDLLEVGSHAVANQKVMVFDSIDRQYRGVLGEDFLSQFDMLIDNERNVLCLDDSPAMAAAVKGLHIALLAPVRAGDSRPAARSLVIEARLSGGMRPVRLKLDSGANVSLLFNIAQYLPVQFLRNPSLQGVGLAGVPHTYAAMPLQDLQIGSLELTKVLFFTFADPSEEHARTSAYDGVLTFGTFRRIFVCHDHQFVVLDPQ
jgi:hypothetical protein